MLIINNKIHCVPSFIDCLCHSTYSICFTSIDERDRAGRTALHNAARYDVSDCIKYLVNEGSDIESRDNNQQTPLALAAWKKHCSSIKALMSLGASETHLPNDKKENIAACSGIYAIIS